MLKPNLFVGNISHGYTYLRLDDAKNISNIDILFLGSSHTYRGFDTRIFKINGLDAFNLGSSNQSPIQSEVLLKRYLKRLSPKIIVLEVYPEVFALDGIESALDIIVNDVDDLNSIGMALKLNHIKIYNTITYSIICELFKIESHSYKSDTKGSDKYISGGYVERKLKYYSPNLKEQKSIKLNEDQMYAFRSIVKIAKQNNIPLILTYAPIPYSTYTKYTNNEYFDSVMTQYGPYYNFNKLMSVDDSLHFYDDNHLNQLGVEAFNKKFIEVLKSM